MVLVFHYTYRGHVGGWVPEAAPTEVQSITRYGYLGVHLFFAISGFVIFMSAHQASARSFFASRISRLFPAYWVSIILTESIVRIGGMDQLTVSWLDTAINLTMLTHLLGAEYVDGAYWSLAVELHFYALMIILIKTNNLNRINQIMMTWLALAAIDIIRPIYPLEFWLIANWAPFFCMGITAYLIRTERITKTRLTLFCISASLAIISNIKKAQDAPTQEKIVISIITIAIIGIFLMIGLNRFRMKENRAIYWAGCLTYPVYLMHEYVGYTIMSTNAANGIPYSLSLLITFIAVTASAFLVHQFVEKKFGPILRRIVSGESDRTR